MIKKVSLFLALCATFCVLPYWLGVLALGSGDGDAFVATWAFGWMVGSMGVLVIGLAFGIVFGDQKT